MPTLRDIQESIPTGSLTGWKMDKEKYNKMLDEYYDIYGWDKKLVFQQKTLIDLGLAEVANDLDKIGKLGKS